jgi:hypothetical protein
MSGSRVDVVGVGVVAVVLLDPPAVAQPDQQVRAEDAQQVVVASGAEHLPMACVVAEEAELDEHDRQERRDHQLPPRRPEPDEHRPTRREQRHGEGDPCPVVAEAPIQQPFRTHQPQQLGVLTAPPGKGRRTAAGLSAIVHVATRPTFTINGVAEDRSDEIDAHRPSSSGGCPSERNPSCR